MTTTAEAKLREASRKLSAPDYAGTIRSFYPYWDAQYRPYLIRAVEALPSDRFDWKPRPEMLTARDLIVHIAEAERGWIHHIVDGGTDEEWVVPHEDPQQGWKTVIDAPDHAAMLALLETWHRPTQHWLDQSATNLSRVITVDRRDGLEWRYTLHWILDHVQEHELHHRAQLNVYLRIMGIEPPGI